MNNGRPFRYSGQYPVFLVLFFSLQFAIAQTKQQTADISAKYDQNSLETLIDHFENEWQRKSKNLTNKAIQGQWAVNSKQQDGTTVALNDIGDDGTLLYYTTHMEPTSKVSRAEALYSEGILDLDLSGNGMRVGVWDSGTARLTHQEFGTRVTNRDGGDVDDHGTLVTGTVISAGIKKNAKGVAYEAEALGHDWSRDRIEVTEAAANGLLLSNHSYGIKTDRVPDWYFGAYIKVSQDWDNIMYNAPYYLMVAAAGNARNSFDNESPNFGRTPDGFDLLLGFTTSKNGLVIAGADAHIDGKGQLKKANVSGYSSFGPTDDGRIKPDLAGDGTLVHSTTADSNTSYSSFMGTSMAAPGVTGSLLLLQEYHKELYGSYMRAATLKGLALHTADDVQDAGPDYKMGWGVINTKKAAETLRNKDFSSLLSEETLVQDKTYSITIKADGTQPLSASISWTDPASETVNRGDLNSQIAALTHDLDIRITQDENTYWPWKLNPNKAANKAEKGDNRVDPFERIDIANPNGEYTITITHKGDLKMGEQDFSLVITGAELTSCTLEAPEEFVIASNEQDEPLLQWAPSAETLYELHYRKETETDWETSTSWENSFPLQGLEYGESYVARVRSVCSQNLVSEFSREIEFTYEGDATVIEENTPLSVTGDLSIQVYPNPADNELQIRTTLSGDAYFSVVSTAGITLKTGKVQGAINVADLASGLYIVTVQDYNGLKSTKFFKK